MVKVECVDDLITYPLSVNLLHLDYGDQLMLDLQVGCVNMATAVRPDNNKQYTFSFRDIRSTTKDAFSDLYWGTLGYLVKFTDYSKSWYFTGILTTFTYSVHQLTTCPDEYFYDIQLTMEVTSYGTI